MQPGEGSRPPRRGRCAMRELCQHSRGGGGLVGATQDGVGWRGRWSYRGVDGVMNEEILQDAGIKPTSYIFLLLMQRTSTSSRGI